MPTYRITRTDGATTEVEADEHAVEGGHHVLRRDALVMGQPRSAVVLRLPCVEVVSVERVP